MFESPLSIIYRRTQFEICGLLYDTPFGEQMREQAQNMSEVSSGTASPHNV